MAMNVNTDRFKIDRARLVDLSLEITRPYEDKNKRAVVITKNRYNGVTGISEDIDPADVWMISYIK